MKHIDYLYFNIYNYFYRISQYRSTYNPRLQALYLFSLGSGGWLLLLESLYLHCVKHSRFTSPVQSMLFAASIYLLTTGFFNYIFIVKDRDQKIFGKYEALSGSNPKANRHLAWSFIALILPYIGLFIFAAVFPRHGR